MGVTLCFDDEDFNMSYSTLQKIRNEVIRATLIYIQSNIDIYKKYEEDEDSENCVKYGAFFESKKIIERWFKEGHDNPLYNNIPGILDIDLQNLILIDLMGIYFFVNHSDCDGYFTVGQVYDIITSLTLIMDNITFHKSLIGGLLIFLKKAYEAKKIIKFL